MWNVFVVGFEPEHQYIEADLDFDNKAEAEAFARRYDDYNYSAVVRYVEN